MENSMDKNPVKSCFDCKWSVIYNGHSIFIEPPEIVDCSYDLENRHIPAGVDILDGKYAKKCKYFMFSLSPFELEILSFCHRFMEAAGENVKVSDIRIFFKLSTKEVINLLNELMNKGKIVYDTVRYTIKLVDYEVRLIQRY
jgi:hypothetical protein